MKVLIIEDENLAADKLKRLLLSIDPTIEVLETMASVEKATNYLLTQALPDLIFMDIQLEDGLSFDIFEKCDLNVPIIFTTAYDEYSLRAFKVNSIDYLLKPINSNELDNALSKYKQLHGKVDMQKLEMVLEQLAPQRKERFLIKVGEHYKSIVVSSISCFYIQQRCSFICLDTGKHYPIDYSLDKVEQMLSPHQFFRVNRNTIINFTAIKDMLSYSSSRIKITLRQIAGEEDIIVSRDRVAEFKRWMDR